MNINTTTAVRVPVYSSSNNHIKQTPQAGIRATYSAAFKGLPLRLTANCREDRDCDTV